MARFPTRTTTERLKYIYFLVLFIPKFKKVIKKWKSKNKDENL